MLNRTQSHMAVPRRTASRRTPRANRSTPRQRPMAQRKGQARYARAPRSWQGVKQTLWTTLAVTAVASFLAGFSYLMIWTYQQVVHLPYFQIQDVAVIQVEGEARLNVETVTALTGLKRGASLLEINPAKLEEALRRHPWIQTARVERLWPDRLRISLVEYQPLAIVQLDNLYFISTSGALFKALEPADQHDLPIITGLRPEHFAVGDGQPAPLVNKVLELCQFLKNSGPPFNFENIAEIHVDSERGLLIYPNNLKVAVDLGFHGYAQKFANLQRVLPLLHHHGHLPRLEKINLNYPQKVLVSLKTTDLSTP